MTPPAGSDLVKAILEARRKAGTVILSAPPAPITPQRTPEGIPTLPKLVPPPTPLPPAPLGDSDLAALLTRLLPQVVGGIDQIKAALGDRKLSFPEALSLATTVAGVVSLAVRDGAPLVKGKSADALVVLIFGVVFDRYAVPLLPGWVRPFAPALKAGAVAGLEALYRAVMKKR
ncbi:hypothetical protein [Deinococcus hopiensis]|uniref:Uncharacterized protein n=1 Tax=Deinococcus hopiensis KR-140 TaxID=695939 RepID=A0A1W1V7S4_9DEIO|nr:hypothetical protein [Deinococcus hopiensis]SMB89230.1 hypothetical protein SAMN00790413_00321 [Deinococcus hopiensis KR-140]